MGFWSVIGAGWRGAFGAIKANWPLFGLLILVNTVLEAAVELIAPLHFVARIGPSGHTMMHIAMAPLMLHFRSVVLSAVFSLVTAPCMVMVHRHILLSEDNKVCTDLKRLTFFGSLIFGVNFALIGLPRIARTVITSATTGVAHSLLLTGFWLLYLPAIWLLIRLVPTYPAAALDVPNPLVTGWRRSAGHWWYIASVMSLGMAPVVIAFYALPMAVAYSSTPERAERLFKMGVATACVVGPFYIAVGAALASELFRKFGGVPAQS